MSHRWPGAGVSSARQRRDEELVVGGDGVQRRQRIVLHLGVWADSVVLPYRPFRSMQRTYFSVATTDRRTDTPRASPAAATTK